MACPDRFFERCHRFLVSSGLPVEYLDLSPKMGARCYCDTCFTASGDTRVHPRGDPPKKYVMPLKCVVDG